VPALERLSRLAAHVLAAPYGLVLLFEHGALPTVVHHGFSSLQSGAVDTFCSKLATLRHPANEVPWLLDVRSEPLLASTVLVSHSPGVRSCVCVPLLASDGSHFGLLCVLDTQTRAVLDPEERTALLDLAATTVEHLETRVLRMRNGSYEPDPLVLATLHTPPESLLQAIFYSSPQAIMLINADLTIRAHNPRAAEIARTIWRRTIRNGDSAYLYLNPWHIVPFTQYVQEAFQGRTVSSMGNARGIDETEYWFETAYIPMFDRNGTVTSVCLHTTDITERQRAASALARSETRFRTMVQHASDIISLIDANGIIRYQSPSAQRILGYAPEEFIGTNALDIVLPEDFSHTARALQNALKQPGIAPPVAFRARHANGSLVYLEAISTNLLDDDAFGHLVVTTRDVTERQHNREQLLMLQSSVQHIAEAIIITEATVDWFEARIVFVNAGFEALTDYSATEMIGQTPRLFQANEADPEMRARLCATLEQGRSFQGEMTLRRRDGSTAIVDWSVNPVHDRDGAISHFVSVQHDISERKQAEHLADDQRRLLEMVVENRPLPDILSQLVQMFRRQHPHVACAVVMRAGDNAAHIVRSDEPGTVAPHYAVINVCACLERLWEHHEPTSLCSLLADCTDNCCTDLIGNRAAQFCVSVPIISGQNDVVGAFLFCQDDREPPLHSYDLMTTVSRLAAVAIERRQLIDQLEHHAYHDLLTRLPNRLLFEQRFQQALDDASASGWLVALLFIDLDRFKQINDSLGHDIGDQLLEQVARRMERSVGAHNTLARLGGDEFACIMPQLNDPILAMDLAQRILAIFNEPFTILDHQLFLTANIGISIYPHNGTDIHTLQRNADIAMYRIKRRGVSGFQYFTSDMNVTLRDPLLEMVAIEEYLRKASIFEELRLHYQPQFRLSDNRLVGVEALLRWEHPTLGMIPPGKFISVAERTGLIRPIGQWVLRQACEQAVAWQRAGYAPFTVAVNVSAEQFAEAGFVEMVERILRESGLEPRWLEVELTESLMLSGFEMTTRHIADLKRLGVSIALDDFGTGHAALVNLQRITLDHLKIDKSFIHDLRFPDKSSQQAIDLIQTIVTMAHKLNLQTVVEGIETKQQAALVRRLGCTRAQGYWFGIPMPASEFESSFRERLNRPSDV
jgi:diguanylate cyclase (GGDEF)-like protein/PAS domain S-box-containing protein